MYIEFEIKKIISDLKDPSKADMGLQKLDKFAKQNPDYDFARNLKNESDQFAMNVLDRLEKFKNGQSW